MTVQEAIKYIFEFLEASDLQAPAREVFKAGIAIGTIQKAIEAKEKEIQEKKTGEWISKGAREEGHEEIYECSICGVQFVSDGINFAYCPKCGSDMRGKD